MAKNGQTQTPKKRVEWEARFLQVLSEGNTVSEACRLARVGRATAYEHRRSRLDFAARWKDAEDAACDMLEAECRRRALEGTPKPVFYQGAECGEVREYSDTLLIFLLKAKRPEEFREETMTPKRFIALFEQMVEILRAEVGEADAARVARRFQLEALGVVANGHRESGVAAAAEP